MERQEVSKRRIGQRIIAGLLALVFIVGLYLSLRLQIRFSGLNYVGQVSEYAAQLTADNTDYLTQSTLDRAWVILKSTIRRPRTYDDFEMYSSIAIAREDYENAGTYLQGCIDTYAGGDQKELAVLYLRLGSLYVLQEDYEGAIRQLNAALEHDPELASAYFLRAQMYLAQGETEKAIEDVHTYQHMEGSDPVILASLAQLYESSGEYENAVECYTVGLENETTYDVELYAGRGRCEMLLEDFDAAQADLETYFQRGGADSEGAAAAMLGMLRMNADDYGGAVTMFHRAVTDGYAEPYLLYSQSVLCAYLDENYATAVRDGTRAIEGAEAVGESSDEFYYWVGMSYLLQEQYADAEDYLDEALKRSPELEDVEYYLGICALAQEKTEEAVEHFSASVEREESVSASLYNRAVCYALQEDKASAMADLDRVIELNEDEELTAQAVELRGAL